MKTLRPGWRLALAIVGIAGVALVAALVLAGPWRLTQPQAQAQPGFECPSYATPWPSAVVTLTPDSGVAGSSFGVQLANIYSVWANPVEAIWDWVPQVGGGQLIASGTIPPLATSFSLSADVPGDAGSGDHTVTVCWSSGGEFPVWVYKQATFDVTEPATQTPPPTEETPTPTPTPEPTEEAEPPEPPATPAPPTPSPTPALSPSQIQGCPQAGKWAISLWTGPDDTEIGEALATCGEGAVDAAYFLDPDTQQWSRWIGGRPDVSNFSRADDLQVLMLFGGAEAVPPVAPTPIPIPPSEGFTPPGQMVNCPQDGGWALSAWVGPDHTPIWEALATCPRALSSAYHLDRATGVWERWLDEHPELSNLEEINNGEGVVTEVPDVQVPSHCVSPCGPYIVVTLEEVQILDDKDLAEEGEIQIVSVVTSGEGKTQKTQYPMKGWVEANNGDWLKIEQPIFDLWEDEMGDSLALVVTAVDNDEIADWLKWSIENLTGPALGALAKAVGAGAASPLVSELGDKLGEYIAVWLGKNQPIGTFTTNFGRDEDWGVWEEYQSEEHCVLFYCWTQVQETSIYEAKADNMIIRYTIHRREALDVPVTVTLEPIEIIEDGDGFDGEIYIWARVADAFSGELLREDITRIPDKGHQDEGDGNYHPDQPMTIFTTTAAGPFVYVEVAVWDEDAPWAGDDDDSLGIFSFSADSPAWLSSSARCRIADAPGNGMSAICFKIQ